MKILYVLPFVVGLMSCNLDSSNYYQQFSYDDLQYLITDRSYYYNQGDHVSYDFPLTYLLNGKDTVEVTAYTDLGNSAKPDDESFFPDYYDFWGSSLIYFPSNTGFHWAKVDINQDTIHNSADKEFSLKLEKRSYYVYYKFSGDASDSIPLDTANIRGVIYQSVLKFYSDSLDRAMTNVKYFYFAKGVGFIKMETMEGKLLELLKAGKANRQYSNQ